MAHVPPAIRAGTLAAALLAATAAPAAAVPTKTYHAEAGRSHLAITHGSDGRPGLVHVDVSVRCRSGERRERDVTVPLGAAATPRAFRVRGWRDTTAWGDAIRLHVDARLRERRTDPPTSEWVGTLSARFAFQRPGVETDLCRLPRVRWRGRVPGEGSGSLSIASDPGDYVGEGRAWSFASPAALFTATGTEREAVVSARADTDMSWSVRVRAPAGERLERGRTYPVQAEQGPDAAALAVSGDHRTCGEVDGEFTVRDARFDRRHRPVLLNLSFLQRCGPSRDGPGLRGTVEYVAPRRRSPSA